MVRIAILEDEAASAKRLLGFLEQYAAEHPGHSFELRHYTDGLRLLDDYKEHFDIIFLDIQLPGISGMETAHRIRAIDGEVHLIFITNMAEYAVEGYEVRAFDYILKPVAYQTFCPKLERVLRAVAVTESETMVQIKQKDGVRWISSNEILYLEVSDHDVYLHLTGGESVRQPGPLSKFEKILSRAYFARNNACYLVNLKHVQGIQGNFVMVGRQQLPISKTRWKGFLNQLAQYKGKSQ